MQKTIDSEDLEQCLAQADFILDVRSPAEFDEDHIPHAENVPVLDNEQRARIGSLYRQDSFEARKIGARHVSESIGRFLAGPLIERADKQSKFLIYCARGGQRSAALAMVLSQIGFSIFRLKRGYKSYRAYVAQQLEIPMQGPIFVLHGYTGSQKTQLIHALADQANVLDLEGGAKHRGSLLGDLPGEPQPSQRAFETELHQTIQGFDRQKPILIEGESRKIGRCMVPDPIWRQMAEARHLWLDLPLEVRIDTILREYQELKDKAYLRPRIAKLARYLSKERAGTLHRLMEEEQWRAFVEMLLVHHYDPLYGRHREDDGKELIRAANFEQALTAVSQRIGAAAPALNVSQS